MKTNYTPDFEMFWLLYPRRWHEKYGWIKRKKEPAYKSWCKLTNDIKAECLTNAKKIKQSEGGSVRDCVTWLNQKGWRELRPEDKKMPTNAEIQQMAQGLFDPPPKPNPKPVWQQRKELLN